MRKASAAVLAAAYFLTNAAFPHAAEASLWAGRRRAAPQPTRPSASDPAVVLKGLPDVRSRVLERWKADVPAPVLERHADLLRAIPLPYGTVRKITPGRGPVCVVFLQDVHDNDEAQANLKKIVESLVSARQASLVGLEAAFAPLDLDKFRSERDRDAVRMAADYLLKEHRITGPVHAGYTFAGEIPPFLGVDDPAHYRANVEAYRRSAPMMESTKYRLALASHLLAKEKSRAFNPELMAFDRAVEDYHKGKLAFSGYVEVLAQTIPSSAPSGHLLPRGEGKDFPSPLGRGQGEGKQLTLFLQALRMEKSMDFAAVERDRARLIEDVVRKFAKPQLDRLLELSLAYRAGSLSHADYYRALKDLCRDLSRYPAMDEYVRYVLLAWRIDAGKLFQEAAAAERAAYARLAVTEEEKRLAAESRRRTLTAKLVDFSLTPEEWGEYETVRHPGEGRYDGIDLSPFESFYEEAEARNLAMAENLLKGMEGKEGAGVLVAGGFHTEGVTRLLADRGVTVIEVAPKLSKIDGPSSAYLGVFTREKTPLEQIFKGEKLFLGHPLADPREVASMAALAKPTLEEVEEASPRLGARATDIHFDDGGRRKAVIDGKVLLVMTVAGGVITALTAVLLVGRWKAPLTVALAGLEQAGHFTDALRATVPYVAGAAVLGAFVLFWLRQRPGPTDRVTRRSVAVAMGVVGTAACMGTVPSPARPPEAVREVPVEAPVVSETDPLEQAMREVWEGIGRPSSLEYRDLLVIIHAHNHGGVDKEENVRRAIEWGASPTRFELRREFMDFIAAYNSDDLSRELDGSESYSIMLGELRGIYRDRITPVVLRDAWDLYEKVFTRAAEPLLRRERPAPPRRSSPTPRPARVLPPGKVVEPSLPEQLLLRPGPSEERDTAPAAVLIPPPAFLAPSGTPVLDQMNKGGLKKLITQKGFDTGVGNLTIRVPSSKANGNLAIGAKSGISASVFWSMAAPLLLLGVGLGWISTGFDPAAGFHLASISRQGGSAAAVAAAFAAAAVWSKWRKVKAPAKSVLDSRKDWVSPGLDFWTPRKMIFAAWILLARYGRRAFSAAAGFVMDRAAAVLRLSAPALAGAGLALALSGQAAPAAAAEAVREVAAHPAVFNRASIGPAFNKTVQKTVADGAAPEDLTALVAMGTPLGLADVDAKLALATGLVEGATATMSVDDVAALEGKDLQATGNVVRRVEDIAALIPTLVRLHREGDHAVFFLPEKGAAELEARILAALRENRLGDLPVRFEIIRGLPVKEGDAPVPVSSFEVMEKDLKEWKLEKGNTLLILNRPKDMLAINDLKPGSLFVAFGAVMAFYALGDYRASLVIGGAALVVRLVARMA